MPLGCWRARTEFATVATALLSDLVDRRPVTGRAVVIDGSKALRKAIRAVLGEVPVQRCVRHRNATCPKRDRPRGQAAAACRVALDDWGTARGRLGG